MTISTANSTSTTTPTPSDAVQIGLDELARQLAATQKVVQQSKGIKLPLLENPKQQEEVLSRAHQHYSAMASRELTVSYAGEWLLDNFYIIQQALNQLVEDMPVRYYAELPKLAEAPLAELPRIYGLARAITDWSEQPVTLDQIKIFLEEYQSITPLTMGELWALPALLRAVNLENLIWTVSQLTGIVDAHPVAAGVELSQQTADELRVANAVINLRMLATQNWKVYFESVSRVEKILRQDPAGIYQQMDFTTRNTYRWVIEHLALPSGYDQEQVAQTAVDLAQHAASAVETKNSAGHIGFYLIGKGRDLLEQAIDYRPTFSDHFRHWRTTYASAFYLGSIGVFTTLILLLMAAYLAHIESPFFQTVMFLLIAFLPATAASINVINWLITFVVPPSLLPKMDFSEGIPSEYRTMVVIPALLSNLQDIDELGQQLELHYLRNSDPALSFALMADYTDAAEQHMAEDDALLAYARKHIEQLNSQYGTADRKPFYFFLRERRWNASENTWMGWERKRGKLAEFNRLILDPAAETSYVVQDGDLDLLKQIRYVITLDADTILPKDTAQRLVGTLAHPLNQAQFDEKGRVVSGYTVLQPRTEISPIANNQTIFTRIFAGDRGIDLYTLSVSDVYQDWFEEGIFTGKGIYDVAAFERSLAGRVRENTLLSHDLFEGLHGRAGLVTDVVLLEDYPPHYLVHTQRLHRWIRGDWQILQWLMPQVPLADGTVGSNLLATVDRWKILDNLRRSLLQPALLLFFVVGWVFLPGSALAWTLAGLLISAIPLLIEMINWVRGRIQEGSWEGTFNNTNTNALRWGLSLAFLPYEAALAVDAIVRTLYRMSKKQQLLQWTTAAFTARLFGDRVKSQTFWQQMAISPILAVGIGVLVVLVKPSALVTSAPLLVLWALAPAIAYKLSQPLIRPTPKLSDEQQKSLRALARRTWLFFERFVGPEDHWLPSDHFQEAPRGIVAHHTSPTNIGLMLLSTLAAYDFGYIGVMELSVSLTLSFENMDKLERYRGHLLNWYDTRSLQPLPPSYVSTVDSGNFVCSLLALRQGLKNLTTDPVLRSQSWDGLQDALAVLEEALTASKLGGSHSTIDNLVKQLTKIRLETTNIALDPEAQTTHLNQLVEVDWPEFTRMLVEILDNEREQIDYSQLSALRVYAERVTHHLQNMQRDIRLLLPWLPLLSQSPRYFAKLAASSPILETWQALLETIAEIPQLGRCVQVYETGQKHLKRLGVLLNEVHDESAELQAAKTWCEQLHAALDEACLISEKLVADLEGLDRQIEAYIETMDFKFLFDTQRKIFHIGYNVTTERLDNSYYDLLASEARLTSLFSIAMGQVPQEHWLHLARPQTRVDDTAMLLSWSGTMFEYLMPMLLTRHYPQTLLDQSYTGVVKAHIAYGRQKHIPWGISESGYYAFDLDENYQYRAFGVPTVAFKRGLSGDLVIAPYASVMALPIAPLDVVRNIDELTKQGALGIYGFYEAVDYTPARLILGQEKAVVREYMAHHQGMIFLTLLNYLHDDLMVERFHADLRIQSVELLLQEQIPSAIELQYPALERVNPVSPDQPQINASPWTVPVSAPVPQVHYLSNGRYGVLLTSTGGGYSQWQSFALTRWRADSTLEDWGSWIYIQDQDNDQLWSAAYQPTRVNADYQNVVFYPHKAEFQRRDQDIFMQMEITVPPEDDLEIRRIRLTNQGNTTRHLFLTTYGEVTLTAQENDQRHPAFNKMFIESEYIPEVNGILFRRRPRSAHEPAVWMMHMLVMGSTFESKPVYETDRARFLGRNYTTVSPEALVGDAGLSNTVGATLDPIMAIGQAITLEPHENVQLIYVTLAGDSRGKVLSLAQTYRVSSTLDQAFDQSRFRNELEMRQLSIHSADIQSFQKMLSALLYPQAALRAPVDVLMTNNKGQSGLWAYGVSGDYPIILAQIHDETEMGLVHDLVQAHIYWRNRKIKVTLILLNQRDSGYSQELYNQIHRMIVRMGSETWINRHDGIFLLRADLLNNPDQNLLRASARVFVDGKNGSLRDQLEAGNRQPVYLPAFMASLPAPEISSRLERPTDLVFDNGFGGFTPDGREYVVYRTEDQVTPSPWINVIANPEFGFTISEAGGGFTWANNSSENRLTVWRNDRVTDMPAEAMYLRDEETAQIWSPMPLPAGTGEPYLIRHGWGYSNFEHDSHGLKQFTHLFAATDASIKIVRLRLENTSERARRVTVTYYAEWVLGTSKDTTQQYVIPEFDSTAQTLLFRNPYSIEFGGQYAFITANKDFHGLTTDRTEFLGRLGSYQRPAGVERIGLAGTVQAGVDPCAAVQLHVDLQPGAAEEVCFIIGSGTNRETALKLAQQYRDGEQIESAWKAVQAFWEATLMSISVETPDKAMNMLTPWLLYQTLSCRIWGRSALYQSSGAFGFRDQLQDVMALLHSHPEIAREHILRAAQYQFEAGDVLHWWHPPSGRGVRTRFSDDLIWLPFVVAQYVAATGDKDILHEKIPFLKGDPLRPEEEERYGYYEPTADVFTVYEHCQRALNKGSTAGSHGLPLMGSGDWNDGMNRVGVKGRGESVWVGWFLGATLTAFVQCCEHMNDAMQADIYKHRVEELRKALEQNAWDGEWYLRAFYDDGSPLGSAENVECEIDSIAQSWAVISKMGDAERAQQAMEAVSSRLVDSENQVLRLFTPPFDKGGDDPGYIKGYPPGIRENGGQYTHAAIWSAWAMAELGDGDTAEKLYRLLNPINHGDTPEKAQHYQVEPYVIAADVYGEAPHTGRGGWTWYTGSSGWMYRLGVEAILGLRREGDKLVVDPCIPKAWSGFALTYRFGKATYHIQVQNPDGVSKGVKQVMLDGVVVDGVLLVDEQGEHQVTVLMG